MEEKVLDEDILKLIVKILIIIYLISLKKLVYDTRLFMNIV